MNKVTVQIPVDRILKLSAEQAVLEQGFSSLQEAIRVFMKQLASKNITLQFFPKTPDKILTTKQEAIIHKKYNQTKEEIKQGKGFVARSVDEMMAQLRS